MNDILCKQIAADYCCSQKDVLDHQNHFTHHQFLKATDISTLKQQESEVSEECAEGVSERTESMIKPIVRDVSEKGIMMV